MLDWFLIPRMLFSFPTNIAGSCVLSMLELVDIVCLDSAVLAKQYRQDLFSSNGAVPPLTLAKKLYSTAFALFLRWLLLLHAQLSPT
jgi:hypothetical protein